MYPRLRRSINKTPIQCGSGYLTLPVDRSRESLIQDASWLLWLALDEAWPGLRVLLSAGLFVHARPLVPLSDGAWWNPLLTYLLGQLAVVLVTTYIVILAG